MIKLLNGQVISEKDPNYQAYKDQQSITSPEGVKTDLSKTVNKDGLTMDEANQSKYWKDGKYVGKDQTIPELSGGNKATYTSDGINDNIKKTATDIAQTETDVLSGIDFNKEISNLLETAKGVNNFTSQELADIERYGNDIGSGYDAQIAAAQAAKTEGMGKSTIGGGRMGGFMNTQITGAGAVNAGVQDWAGAGGKLESIKSAYDRNIADLQTKKVEAIALAKQARAEYIRTGKSTALTAVQNALNAAQTLNQQIIQNQSSKADLLIKAAQEARTKKTQETADTTAYISNMAQAGLEDSAIPQDKKAQYEETLGLPAGTFDQFYADVKLATEFQKAGRYADFSAKITEILSQVPQGQTITIGGQTYEGLGELSTTETDYDKLLSPTEAAALGVPYGTTKGQAADQGITPKETLTGQDKISMEVKLAGNFEQYAKESKTAVKQLGIMDTAWKTIQDGMDTGYITNPDTGKKEKFNLNAPSQAMLVTYQKLLDPTSVVRESEYARSGDGQSLVNRIEGLYDKLNRGGAGVTVQDLSQFHSLSQELLKNYQAEQLDLAARIQTQANNYGLNIENILTPSVLNILQEAGINTTQASSGGDQWGW